MKLKKIKLPEFKRLNTFLSNRFGEILLTLILILVSLLSFKQGFFLLSNDNYSPELNPTLSVQRYIESPAWRSYRVLGFASESEQADVFRSGMFTVLDTFLPNWSIGQIFALISLFVGTLSMAYLTTLFVRDFVSTKYSKYIFLISGVMYLTTLWTAWVFNFNMMPYITQFGFLPLLLLSIYLLMKAWSWGKVLLLCIASLLFSSSSVIATLFFVNIFLITGAFIYWGYLFKRKIKEVLIGIGLFFLLQLFWFLPFIQYTFSSTQNIIDSYTNRAITANTIDLESQMMTLPNSARFYTRLLGTIDDPSTESYIFPMSEDFQAYDIYKVVGLFPLFLSIMGLIFCISKKKWKLLPLWFVLFTLLFLLKNQNPPLGGIYIWLQENLNIFKQVFRWVSSKLGQPYLILLVITALIGFLYLVDFYASFFRKRERKLFVLIPVILMVAIPLFYSEYLFKGQLFTSRAVIDLPKEYYSLAKALKEDGDKRVFYAPPANNGYFREYEWGFVGSQFLGYIIPNPLMDMSLAIGSDVGESAMLELQNDFESANLTELNRDLEKYDVKYILIDRSLIKGRYGYELNWELVDKYTKSWEKVWSENFLELYKLKEKEVVKYVESVGQNSELESGYFVRKYSQEPLFSSLNIDLNDAVFSKNNLVKKIEYTGVNTILYSNYNKLDIEKLPTTIKKVGTEIVSTLATPSIKGLNNSSYKRATLPSSKEYVYIFGQDVFTQGQLEQGINLYNSWGSINQLSIVQKSSLRSKNYTEILSKSKPGDCSGGEYRIMPNVVPQERTSGFVIEGNSDLPCLYTEIRLDKRLRYVGEILLNWESSNGTDIGYCLYSSNSQGCLNEEKFLHTTDGYGDITIPIPKLINGGDNLSLVLYALNSKGEKASLIVRNIELKYSNEIKDLALGGKYIDKREKSLSINNGESLTIKVPVFNNGPSYVYSFGEKESLLWQPNIAEDRSLPYLASFDEGMKQSVQNQYLNQYHQLFKTDPTKRYLWYWAGENISNIPSSVCLTYVGDDKCWVDSTFFDDKLGSEARIFSPISSKENSLDASFNSISFKNLSENILKDFIVMEIPNMWFDFQFEPILPREFTESKMQNISESPNSTFYKINTKEIKNRDRIISIPQAKSDSWIAIGFTDFFVKLIPNTSRVYLNGWQQGWDISGMNNLNTVFVFYLPNLISYLGYGLIVGMFGITSFYLFKSVKKYERK